MKILRLQKQPLESGTYTIDFTEDLDSDETLSSIISMKVIPSGLTLQNENINSSEIIIDSIRTIDIGKAVQIDISDGANLYEYLITLRLTTSASNNIETDVLMVILDTTTGLVLEYYGSVFGGDDYFATKLHSSAWDEAEQPSKRKALVEATQRIDRLNFRGVKNNSEQSLQFPRGTDDDVPQDIEFATYELAYSLLDGIDPELEIENLSVLSRSYASVSTNYNRRTVPEYVLAGIPSAKAWSYLKPYLRNPGEITIQRG